RSAWSRPDASARTTSPTAEESGLPKSAAMSFSAALASLLSGMKAAEFSAITCSSWGSATFSAPSATIHTDTTSHANRDMSAPRRPNPADSRSSTPSPFAGWGTTCEQKPMFASAFVVERIYNRSMDCPIASRADRRRSAKRNRVLDEAEAMFTADSYAAVRIEEVADAADISVGTVYNYFGGKEGLYLAVSERVLDRVEELLAPAYDPDLAPERAITLLGECYLEALIRNPIACRSLVSDTQTPGGDIADGARDRIVRLYDSAAVLIDRGISEGVVTPMNSALAARFII